MPDRVILRFPEAIEKIGAIHVPGNWGMRPELGELVHCGDALSPETEILRQHIVERAQQGHMFLVPMATGTHFWRKEMGAEFEFLKDIRAYRITELSVSVRGVETP